MKKLQTFFDGLTIQGSDQKMEEVLLAQNIATEFFISSALQQNKGDVLKQMFSFYKRKNKLDYFNRSLALYFFGLEAMPYPSLLWTEGVGERFISLFDPSIQNHLDIKKANQQLKIDIETITREAALYNELLESVERKFLSAMKMETPMIGFHAFVRILLTHPRGVLKHFFSSDQNKETVVNFLRLFLKKIVDDFYDILKEQVSYIHSHHFYKEMLELTMDREPEIRLEITNLKAYRDIYYLWHKEGIH